MTTLGERFADAIAQRDPEAMSALIADEIDFRGMTPSTVWEATDAAGVIDAVLGNWFEEKDLISSAVRAESDSVSDTRHVSYRFQIDNEEGPQVAEQQAYYREEDGRIVWMRVLCSGFRPRD